MPAAEYWGLDSDAFLDDEALSTWHLQRMREALQFIDDERAAIVTVGYQQARDVAGVNSAIRLPRHAFAQWALRGPWSVWVPDGVPAVDVILRCSVTVQPVNVAAYSATATPDVTATKLDDWVLAAPATWAEQVAVGASQTIVLEGVQVRPGWNDIVIAIRSELDAVTKGTGDATVLADGTGLGPPTNWPAFASTATTSESMPERYVLLPQELGAGGDPAQVFTVLLVEYPFPLAPANPADRILLAEQEHDLLIGVGHMSQGGLDFGQLGVLEVFSIAINPNRNAATDYDRLAKGGGLRWYMAPSGNLVALARGIVHRDVYRQPMIQCGANLELTDKTFPGHWRVFSFVDLDLVPDRTLIYQSIYAHRTTEHAGQSPRLEVRVPVWVTYRGTDARGRETFELRVTDHLGVLITSATVEVELNGAPNLSMTSRWVQWAQEIDQRAPWTAVEGRPLSHDGTTALGEAQHWNAVVLDVDVSALSDHEIVIVEVRCSSTAGRPYAAFGEPGMRLAVGSV